MNKEDMMNNSNMVNKGGEKNPQNQSPVVKLSLESDELINKNNIISNPPQVGQINQVPQMKIKDGDDIGKLTMDTINLINNLKVLKKKVEINTKITYTYEDGSTRVITQNESHELL